MAKLNFKKIQGRVMSAAGLVAGSVASGYANTTIENLGKGKITPVMNAGIRLLIGAALPSVVGGKASTGFMNDFSNGMMASAGLSMAKALNIPGISGTDIDYPMGDYSVAGTDVSTPVSGTHS
jgi:hypothetical protein